jgi:hypothetical protein
MDIVMYPIVWYVLSEPMFKNAVSIWEHFNLRWTVQSALLLFSRYTYILNIYEIWSYHGGEY